MDHRPPQTQPGTARTLPKLPPRNQPCPCGSGVKFKKCCWPYMQEFRRQDFVERHEARRRKEKSQDEG